MTKRAIIERTAATTEQFRTLPPNLRQIAINTACELLDTLMEGLLLKAGEVDTLAIEDRFARFAQEMDGKLLANFYRMRMSMSQLGYSSEDVERVTSRLFKVMIASRLSRIRLAKALRYRPRHGRSHSVPAGLPDG